MPIDNTNTTSQLNTPQTHAFVMGERGFTLFINGKNFAVSDDNPNYQHLLEQIRAKDWDAVDKLLDIKETVATWLADDKDFKIDGGLVYLNNEPFSEPVSAKVLRMIKMDLDATPLLKFLRKVRTNPSYSAQQELLLFCVANGFGITDDGDIIAYKLVRDDYLDHYTGTLDNTPGKTVSMPRHQVDDRRDVTCSHGLHFAAFEYANAQYHGGTGKLLSIKVNPTDVVSIPSDYNNQKGRCCKYEVVGEMAVREPLPSQEVYTAKEVTGRDNWSYDTDCDCDNPDCRDCQ
jgi:hypothetical protein